MWDFSKSRPASWKWFAISASAEDLRPIRFFKAILLNEQVKLVHQVQLRFGNFTVIPFVMVQYEPDVGYCPRMMAPAK